MPLLLIEETTETSEDQDPLLDLMPKKDVLNWKLKEKNSMLMLLEDIMEVYPLKEVVKVEKPPLEVWPYKNQANTMTLLSMKC
jgi:hypothetical protein